jgi:transcriptional regulator with XRE-family HTH domain
MAEDEVDRALAGVGARLRTLRRDRAMTLADLSRETGISASTLSRLESGGRRPNLELLLPVARAFDVGLDELVGSPPVDDPRSVGRPIREGGRVVVPLTRRPAPLQAFKQTLPGVRRQPVPSQNTHEGWEWLYVLSGRLRLALGDQDLVLQAGEAAEFDTRVPHWFGAAGAETTEFIGLFSKQGQRVHLRARSRPRER